YQESYDNNGLIVGNPTATVTGVLVTLDCLEEVVDEAIDTKCNLIVAHHPIVFNGLKKLTGQNHIERTVIKAIKNDVAIYAIHTNLDNVDWGVNKKIADQLGLTNTKILAPKIGSLLKLTTFVPHQNKDAVINALHEAGAGNIGNYAYCSFQLAGEGTFLPKENAKPNVGKLGKLEKVSETRVEVLLPEPSKNRVLQALFQSHPYEEVAYYLSRLENEYQQVGAGMVGDLPEAIEPFQFLQGLKKVMDIKVVRHTNTTSKKVKRVAVCGGSGSFLLPHAISSGADVFVSADFKYHEFFDAEGKIIIADIGHYESEQYTKQLLAEVLSKKFTSFAATFSKTNTNPISYL
ncbi:MAG: Nif3-like dinuclear metal center hexameric protein, partial [Flammeovirgaceae bacterium]